MKSALLVLTAIVTAACLFAQNAPSDKPPTPQPLEYRIRVSERILNNMAFKRVLPQPPWSKDNAHQRGEVTVRLGVGPDGAVKMTHVVSGDPVLGAVAERAVKQRQFHPYVLNGVPIPVISQIEMRFSKNHAEVVVGER